MGCGDMSVFVCVRGDVRVCVSEAELVENINSLLAEKFSIRKEECGFLTSCIVCLYPCIQHKDVLPPCLKGCIFHKSQINHFKFVVCL